MLVNHGILRSHAYGSAQTAFALCVLSQTLMCSAVQQHAAVQRDAIGYLYMPWKEALDSPAGRLLFCNGESYVIGVNRPCAN